MTVVGIQKSFFARLAEPQAVRMMFEHLPDVFFYIKDDRGRFIAANTATCLRCGLARERDLVGTTDTDFFPAEIARAYCDDDRSVIRTGKPLIDRLELFYDEQHGLDWFLTTKLPLRDVHGRVIGIMGITRRDEKRMMDRDVVEATSAVRFATDNARRATTAADLARAVGVSERHLYRKVRAALGTTPYELLLRTRIRSAADELARTSRPISDIAFEHGFCDQSAFTQQFRKRVGQTPREFRRRHGIGGAGSVQQVDRDD